MPRHLFIVSRDFPDLYEYLTERFSDDDKVAVFLDRRFGERRRASIGVPGHGEKRRRVGRRLRAHLDDELRTQPHVVVTLS